MKGVAFITGATSGFGAACARRFGKNGWRLVLAARRKERLEALKEELSSHAKVHIAALDLQDREKVLNAVDELPDGFREVDLLINNAGVGLNLGPAYEGDLDDWETMVDTNIKGLLYCTRAILPGMVARNRGHIVNIGSVAGSYPYPSGNVYGASKAFVKHFSQNLRADLFGKRVRVTNIEPGIARTEFSLVRFGGNKEKAKAFYEGIDTLTPDDIAEAVFWAATLPPHVNVNSVEIMPTAQTWGSFAISRGERD